MKIVSLVTILNGSKKRTKDENSSSQVSSNGFSLQKFSSSMSNLFHNSFYILGFTVAKNPLSTILTTFLFTLLCSIGFYHMNTELNPLKLWVPQNSDYVKNTYTILDNIGEGIRRQSLLIVARDGGNVLNPTIMKKLLKITDAMRNISIISDKGDIVTMDDICFKIPLLNELFIQHDRKRRSITSNHSNENSYDYETADIDTEIFCELVKDIPFGCVRENILEMWASNETRIENTTESEIIRKLNELFINPETGHDVNFTTLLGGKEFNELGHIISAKSLISTWYLRVNFSDVDDDKNRNKAGTEGWATYDVLQFESEIDKVFEKFKKEFDDEEFVMFHAVYRSYGDISSKEMFTDINKVIFGVTMMMFYMIFVLSKYGWVEIRCSLAAVGLLNVGMAYVSGCGLASLLFPYSPFHTSLFFIIMGLGVDDIFVISSCLRKVSVEHKNLSLPEKIGKTLSKAGTSITITSLTDIIAFLVGGTTVLPSLKSFCIFAAFCICMNYIFVVTFFVACLVIDEKRIMQNRNGCFPLIVHKVNKVWCEPKLMEKTIRFIYSKFVLKRYGKIIIVLMALGISGFSIHRVLKIKEKFNPMWFIPTHSQYFQYEKNRFDYYPSRRGIEAGIYFTNFAYEENLTKILNLATNLRNLTNILNIGDTWIEAFDHYVNEKYQMNLTNPKIQFNKTLSNFLFSEFGGKYQFNFKFEDNLECGQPAGNIKISFINFRFLDEGQGNEEQKFAKYSVLKMIEDINFDRGKGEVFLWGELMSNWLTDETVDKEIYANIVMILIGVFCCTIIMITKFEVCALIFLCVLLSLITLGGLMEISGLTLDIITCFSLQLSVGLCIDFATHIGHTFLTINEGDGNTRALKTAEEIGEAVWQGGISTMIALSLLAISDAYTYQIFFKIFAFVVFSGIFYGTFFLPVALSIFNPKPYTQQKFEEKQQKA